ncbi:MAG: hypothetical protein AAGJ52_10950 [Pseudomonadota bacterium]
MKPWRALISSLMVGMMLAALPMERSLAQPVVEPDFDAMTDLMAEALQSNGPAQQPGDRAELYRFTPEGWEVQLFGVWSGERWMLLAANVHHPALERYGQGDWMERYTALLSEYDPEWVERLRIPDLFEVPPPDYLPVVPDEVRSRRFVWQGYWYEARWFNSGGVDIDADWSIVSYDLVALPPPEPEASEDGL